MIEDNYGKVQYNINIIYDIRSDIYIFPYFRCSIYYCRAMDHRDCKVSHHILAKNYKSRYCDINSDMFLNDGKETVDPQVIP